MPNAKHWAGCTLNNYTPTDEAKFLTLIQPKADYYIYGKEVGENGTPHLQFMLCLKTRIKLSGLKKIFPTAHLEIKSKFSSMADASNYCKKGDQSHAEWLLHKTAGPNFGVNANFIEWGVLPKDQQVAGGQAVKDKFAEAKACAEEDRLDDIDPEILIKHYTNLKRIRSDKRNKKIPTDLNWIRGKDCPNVWYWGKPNTGKSRRAREELGTFYSKMNNKWYAHSLINIAHLQVGEL